MVIGEVVVIIEMSTFGMRDQRLAVPWNSQMYAGRQTIDTVAGASAPDARSTNWSTNK